MALVDKIETLGCAVERGQRTRDQAIQELLDDPEVGLTRASAEDLIDDWANARARYETVRDQALNGLIGIDPVLALKHMPPAPNDPHA